jgi:hypothetical protein
MRIQFQRVNFDKSGEKNPRLVAGDFFALLRAFLMGVGEVAVFFAWFFVVRRW